MRRRGVSPLGLTVVVAARSRDEAAGIATALAENQRGGMFESGRVRSLGPAGARVAVDA
ncbi:MAG: hypothetical protein JHC74_10515 [Thermoleophilia bacterium]|nr:hypothetical protein [Thermoleophilia bacterium]